MLTARGKYPLEEHIILSIDVFQTDKAFFQKFRKGIGFAAPCLTEYMHHS